MVLDYARSTFKSARVVVLGVPYDRTSSFVPGSRFGPEQVRIASVNIESYSPWLRRDAGALRIHDAGDLEFAATAWPAVASLIRGEVTRILKAGKLPIMLGGEHTVSVPAIAACHARFPELAVIQFDAHADLRRSFQGDEFSHACAMFQAGRIVGPESVFQYGIRSGTEAEFRLGQNLYRFDALAGLTESKRRFENRPLYVTIDIDVLDPGVMPAVATPEPGGISYRELLGCLRELDGSRIAGADIVEYNPLANRDFAPAALVAGLLRELILTAAPESGARRKSR